MSKKETDKSRGATPENTFSKELKGTGNAALDASMKELMGGNVTAEGLNKLFEASQGGIDDEALKALPGVVVDEKSGDMRLFGIKMPGMPKEVIAPLAALYTGSLKFINDNAGPKTYETARRGLVSMGVNHQTAHYGGIGTEVGIVFLLTHWQDIGSILSAQDDHKGKLNKFARQMAPVVDEIRGHHGIGATMSVKKGENEVIWAQRQRLNDELRLEYLTTAIAASGRATELIRYGIDRYQGWGQESHDASKRDGINKSEEKRKEAEDKILGRVTESNEFRKKLLAQGTPTETAEEMVKSQFPDLFDKQKVKAGIISALDGKGSGGLMDQVKQVAPAIGTMISENYAKQFMDAQRKKVSSVSAYDMIMTLVSQLDSDPTMESYDLPDKMRLQDGQHSLKLERYVEEIFRRHEQDMDPDNKIGKRLDEKLKDASKVIAQAIKDGDVDGMALVALVGERHIVRPGAKVIVDKEHVRDEVRVQMVKSHRHNTVDEAEYYAESNFTRADLKAALESVEGEERQWFASLFPDNVLENAGMKQEDIKTVRAASQDEIGKHVLEYAQVLKEQGVDFLKSHEATKDEQNRILDAANTSEYNEKKVRDLVSKPGKVEGVQHDIAQVLVQHVKHDGKLSELLRAQGPIDEAVNDNAVNDNTHPDFQVDAATIQHEKSHAHAQGIE